MTTMSSIDRYPIDTTSDDNVWVMMRRAHCHASDVIANRLHQRLISTTDRRILDALDYVRTSGVESVAVSTLCALIPILLKPQTAGSALERLAERDLVESTKPHPGSPRRWRLTGRGMETRGVYGYEVEQILIQMYGPSVDEVTSTLLDQTDAAVDSMNDRFLPVLEYEVGLDVHTPAPMSTGWSTLRRIHFYIDDLIYRETEPFGVGRAERRILDALGLAAKHGVEGGLNVGTICRLNEALSRQVAETALRRMHRLEWVEHIVDQTRKSGSRSRRRWELTAKGLRIRELYKRYAQLKLREVIDLDEALTTDLLAVAAKAHRHRDNRCLPVIDHFKRSERG